MAATVTTRFDPSRLNLAIATGFKRSVAVAALDAKAHSPSPARASAVGIVRGSTGYLKGTGPLTSIFESGASPHEIAPKKKALFGKGYAHPVAFTVQHPGAKAQPYLGPAAQRWAQAGCRATMRVSLVSGGFR